jgi:hypothetical protein
MSIWTSNLYKHQYVYFVSVLRIRIRIRRIHVFLDLPDPDPLVRDPDHQAKIVRITLIPTVF